MQGVKKVQNSVRRAEKANDNEHKVPVDNLNRVTLQVISFWSGSPSRSMYERMDGMSAAADYLSVNG